MTYVNVPDRFADIIRSGSGSQFSSITSNGVVPILGLKIPNRPREKTGSDEIQETGGRDKEELKFG